MTDAGFVLRADTLRAALSSSSLRSIPSEVLATFLSGRRWFGGKGTTPAEASIVDVVPTPWGENGSAVTRLRVKAGDKTLEFQLPLTISAAGGSSGNIARVEAGDGTGFLVDATADSAFRQGVGDAFDAGASFRGENSEWRIERAGNASPGIGGLTPKLGSAEQSNTSMTFGDKAILKFFRRLETGDNPDVEIGSALSEASFASTPRLLGRMRFITSGGDIDAGMLQQIVPGSTDAWSYALKTGKAYFSSPSDDEPVNTFARDAESLGRVTRAMHEALASIEGKPAFASAPASSADIQRWVRKAQESVALGLDLLDSVVKRRGLPKERLPEAEVLLRRREHSSRQLEEIGRAVSASAGSRIRHHGDYHLGQVLRAADGKFFVIDFEGEPARSLAERRESHSPLRDVAGMLRSFAYAAATLATEAGPALDGRTRELRSARWEREAREAFLRGYLASTKDAGAFLPKDEAETRQLISLFETEKVFYELAYELNNRPDWVWIPMRGISKLLVASQLPTSGAPTNERSRPVRGSSTT